MTDLGADAHDSRRLAVLRLARAWWPAEAAFAMRLAVTSIVAMYLCMLFELETPEWAGWTVISVSLATRANSLQKSLWRVAGTIAGALVAFAIVDAFAQATLAFDIALALYLFAITTISTIQRGFRVYGFAVMGYTVPIVILGDILHPQLVFYTAVDRCSTIIVGIACADASYVLVADGVRTVARNLASTLGDTVESCAAWCRAVRAGDASVAPPPIGKVLALDSAMQDSFTEQPSLRAGATTLAQVPVSLLHLLAIDMLRRKVGKQGVSSPRALLGRDFIETDAEWDRMRGAGPRLRRLERDGWWRVPPKPLAVDWDGVQAVRNGLRAAVAVSLANALWYVSNWPGGSAIASWAALVSVLYATRDDGALLTRHFLVGAVMAAAVGVGAKFILLSQSYSFAQLAIVLLPILLLATIGYNEKGAAYGGGYAFLVLGMLAPTNVMTYDLGAALNDVLGTLIGVGTVVACFTFLVPSATLAIRRLRAKRRMMKAVRAIGRRPILLLPKTDNWLAKMAQRLDRLSDDPAAVEGGQTLLVVGLLLLALRRHDARLGREAAKALWVAPGDVGPRLAGLAGLNAEPLQRARLEAIISLMRTDSLDGWPGAPTRLSA